MDGVLTIAFGFNSSDRTDAPDAVIRSEFAAIFKG